MRSIYFYEYPVGAMGIAEEDGAICGVFFGSREAELDEIVEETPLIRTVAAQLTEYFGGKRAAFDFPMTAAGTPFQQSVWNALCAIPFGETRSYRDIAAAVGNPNACRAVGSANHRNPLAIVVPCHRVITSAGGLGGYGGGLPAKLFLLELEKKHVA